MVDGEILGVVLEVNLGRWIDVVLRSIHRNQHVTFAVAPSALAKITPPLLAKTDPPIRVTTDGHARSPEETVPDLPAEGPCQLAPHSEEQAILAAAPQLAPYVEELKRKGRKVIALLLRQLLRLVREYPREPLLAALDEAARYGLYDLDRVERMILRRVAREYFLLEGNDD